MNNPHSEKYRKYLVVLTLNGHTYYTVSGMDLQDEEKDKVLVDENNKVALFRNIESLISYISRAENLFDRSNFKLWANDIQNNEKPYANCDIDALDQVDDLIRNGDAYENIVDILYLIQDYAIQTDNDELKNILDSEKLLDFRNFFVENYIFNGDENKLDHIINATGDLQLKELLNTTREHFLDSIIIH